MTLVEMLCVGTAHLVCRGLGIVGFFASVRLVTLMWKVRPLIALDQVGQIVVDPLVNAVRRTVPLSWFGDEPSQRQLATLIVMLAIGYCAILLDAGVHRVFGLP